MLHDFEHLSAERGYIYEWEYPREPNKYNKVLVISNNNRQNDNLVSILFLSTYRGNGDDVVKVNFEHEAYCVHTDLITYTQRAYLTRKLAKVSDKTMGQIDLMMSRSLGLPINENLEYKRLYENLLSNVVGDKDYADFGSEIQTDYI